MALSPGDTAPDFTLYNTEKQAVSLSGLRGKKVLILFIPLAFTSTCTKELCMVRDDISEYNNLDAEVFGISVDSLYSLKKFKEEQSLNFNLLSDFNKTASEAYDSIYESFIFDMKGVSKRSAFIVDQNGIIRYAEVLENSSDIPDLAKIKQILKTI